MNDNDLDMMGDGPMLTLADVAAQAEKTPLQVCDGCGKKWRGTYPIEDESVRTAPGGKVPSGECPDCGALCFPEETPKAEPPMHPADMQIVLIDLYGDGDVIHPYLNRPGVQEAALEWDKQNCPCNFTQWMIDHGFRPLEHCELKLKNA